MSEPSAGDRAAIALIAGLDPSGGAGLLRDAWTAEARAPQLERLAVCTAVTRQAEGRPVQVASARPERFARELAGLAAAPGLAAIKIGMVPGILLPALIEFLDGLRVRQQRPAVVLDPVGEASEGGRLGAPAGALIELVRRVDLVTPNQAELAELRALMGVGELDGLGQVAVLAKGEAVTGRPDRVRDRLVGARVGELIIERPRLSGPDPRGTGCALATAVAAELAGGRSLVTAVVAGVAWLDGARRHLRRGPDGRHHLRR